MEWLKSSGIAIVGRGSGMGNGDCTGTGFSLIIFWAAILCLKADFLVAVFFRLDEAGRETFFLTVLAFEMDFFAATFFAAFFFTGVLAAFFLLTGFAVFFDFFEMAIMIVLMKQRIVAESLKFQKPYQRVSIPGGPISLAIFNHLQPSSTTFNHLQLPSTIFNYLQPSSTTFNHLQPFPIPHLSCHFVHFCSRQTF
jgi:hypothetical protein